MIIDHQIENFLDHYGVKGMTWGTTKEQSLDRIYRVEAGTSSRRDKIQKARKALVKDVVKDDIDLESQKSKVPPPDKNKAGETSTKTLLEKVGMARLVDLVN